MNPGTLLIRADANVAIGTGHVMRCLALAQAWKDAGGASVLASVELPPLLESRVQGEMECVRLEADAGTNEDGDELARLAREKKATWCVVDGARFDSEYVHVLKGHGQKVLRLDDLGSTTPCEADLMLNQDLGASPECYPWCHEPGRLLLGTDYILLRREFLRMKPRMEIRNTSTRVLVAFGGSDPDGMTEKVLRALGHNVEGIEVTAVAGSANPQVEQLQSLASSTGATFLCDAVNLPEIMAKSDLAVIAAGGTMWELLYCGCAVLSYCRNQAQASVIEKLLERGAVCDLGLTPLFDDVKLRAEVARLATSPEVRRKMREEGHRIVDGFGPSRVIRILRGE